MGRRAKPPQSKKQKATEELAKLMGIEAPKEEAGIQQARTEEAILAYVKAPALFKKRQCERCNNTFAVNRANVAYCGTFCRVRSLANLGITYRGRPDGESKQEWIYRVYGAQGEPLVVPPSALRAAQAALRAREDQQSTELKQSESSTEDIVSGIDDILGTLTESDINTGEQPISMSNEKTSSTNGENLLDFTNSLLDDILNGYRPST